MTWIRRATSGCVSLLATATFTAFLGACTSVTVDPEAGAYEQLPQPDRVLVYNFAVEPQEVQLDAVGSAITKTFDGTADSAQEQEVGHAVANALAKHLVSSTSNITGGSQVANQTLSANVDSEAARLGDKIADQLRQLFVQKGWIAGS
jgi:hypothetical protein